MAAIEGGDLRIVEDCHVGQYAKAAKCAAQLAALCLRHRPRNLVTTGALPGLLAIMAGRAVGASTFWIDSLANAETLSVSGRHAKRIAHHHFTQWPELARREGTQYAGSLF